MARPAGSSQSFGSWSWTSQPDLDCCSGSACIPGADPTAAVRDNRMWEELDDLRGGRSGAVRFPLQHLDLRPPEDHSIRRGRDRSNEL